MLRKIFITAGAAAATAAVITVGTLVAQAGFRQVQYTDGTNPMGEIIPLISLYNDTNAAANTLNGTVPTGDGTVRYAAAANALAGRPVAGTAPTSGQALVWTGSGWAPGADAGIRNETDTGNATWARTALPGCTGSTWITSNGSSLSCVSPLAGPQGYTGLQGEMGWNACQVSPVTGATVLTHGTTGRRLDFNDIDQPFNTCNYTTQDGDQVWEMYRVYSCSDGNDSYYLDKERVVDDRCINKCFYNGTYYSDSTYAPGSRVPKLRPETSSCRAGYTGGPRTRTVTEQYYCNAGDSSSFASDNSATLAWDESSCKADCAGGYHHGDTWSVPLTDESVACDAGYTGNKTRTRTQPKVCSDGSTNNNGSIVYGTWNTSSCSPAGCGTVDGANRAHGANWTATGTDTQPCDTGFTGNKTRSTSTPKSCSYGNVSSSTTTYGAWNTSSCVAVP